MIVPSGVLMTSKKDLFFAYVYIVMAFVFGLWALYDLTIALNDIYVILKGVAALSFLFIGISVLWEGS